ncbi:hypothetical protein [Limimaricola cinnabarinus]|jgi:hypothetical protein|nr:hypothetical protein [Limimaricola cinnabarinus]
MSSSKPGVELRLVLMQSLDWALIPSAIICALAISAYLAGS